MAKDKKADKKADKKDRLVIASLFQKHSTNDPKEGLVYSEEERTELKPAHLLEESFVDTFNANSLFGKIYIIDEDATEEANEKIKK